MSLFGTAELAPADPILGLTEAFVADQRPEKVNLGVGVYLGEDGKLPLLKAVAEAEQRLAGRQAPKGYLPIDGMVAYREAVRALVFGADAEVLAEGRVVTAQSLGGTGALKLGADLSKLLDPSAKVLISDPSWENHRALFTRAGFTVDSYRYYDAEVKGINVEGMLDDLRAADPGTIVVMHACCHNPTGYDLTPAQWDQVVAIVAERGLVAFLDMAYQGFGFGIAEDGAVIGKFVDAGLSFLLSTSYSKSFSLYGERIGSLNVVTASADEAKRVQSQLKIVIRTNYSNPPTQGAALVATVLGDAVLKEQWAAELGAMRDRIKQLRSGLVEALAARGVSDMGFVADQLGMFSYSGLTKDQMIALRTQFGVYGLDSGRMCVAALNASNLGYVADSISAVRG